MAIVVCAADGLKITLAEVYRFIISPTNDWDTRTYILTSAQYVVPVTRRFMHIIIAFGVLHHDGS